MHWLLVKPIPATHWLLVKPIPAHAQGGNHTHPFTPLQLGSHTELDSKVLQRASVHPPPPSRFVYLIRLAASAYNAMQDLPTFTPSTSVVGGGLDLLTSVIPLTSADPIQTHTRPLSACGPFNPTAALPSKTVLTSNS